MLNHRIFDPLLMKRLIGLFSGVSLLLLLSNCGPAVAENLPDTSPVALKKPILPAELPPASSATEEPIDAVEVAPETPVNPPPVEETPKPDTDAGSETVNTNPEPTPPPVPQAEPCTQQDREIIASKEKNIQKNQAYLQTLSEDDDGYDQVFLDIQEAKLELAKYKKDNNCK